MVTFVVYDCLLHLEKKYFQIFTLEFTIVIVTNTFYQRFHKSKIIRT